MYNVHTEKEEENEDDYDDDDGILRKYLGKKYNFIFMTQLEITR